jgi:hypothetical protein
MKHFLLKITCKYCTISQLFGCPAEGYAYMNKLQKQGYEIKSYVFTKV